MEILKSALAYFQMNTADDIHFIRETSFDL